MSQSNPRFDPLQILDADFRSRVWKRWLRSRWLGVEDVAPPPPEGNCAKTVAPPAATPAVDVASPVPIDAARETDARRREARARFDGLLDRVGIVEDHLDSLVKRFTLNALHQRRHEQRVLERIESSGEMLERQTLAFEAMQAALERVEQRLERLERRWRDAGSTELLRYEAPRGASSLEFREPRGAAAPQVEYEDYADLEEALNLRSSVDATDASRDALESLDDCSTTPCIHGNLSEMSLGTVLAMLELERRTGLLQVSSEDGRSITATLRNGAIVGARRRDIEADPVEAVRDALRFKNGRFRFRQSKVEIASGPPRSVGSVLLEASSRNDEAARAS
jgi:hypothetical protein